MSYLLQVQAGVDYIESNLDDDIALADVAKAANISQWHFQRIFKALTNETLKSYIRSRRLANSLDKLLQSKARIVDISLAAGFESQESYTRAFKKAFDMTPNEYRNKRQKNLLLKKVQFDRDYLLHISQNVSLEPVIYTQENMLLAGLTTEFFGVDSEKNNVAKKLPPLWDAFLGRMHEIEYAVTGMCYGVIQQTREHTDKLEYFAGIAVTRPGPLPDKFVHVSVPSCTYAKFVHKGEVNNLNSTINYIYSNWLLQSGMRHTYGADLEFYGCGYQPASDDSIMEYAIPVKREDPGATVQSHG